MIGNATLSEIIFALEQIEDAVGDKEVIQTGIITYETEKTLFVEFADKSNSQIEIKTMD